MVILLNNEAGLQVDEDLLVKIAESVLEAEEVPSDAELSVAFVDNEEIARLNKEYRGIDGPTDVLSFEMEEEPGEEPLLLGDVIIAPEIARAQAEELDHSYEAEMGLLLVHGILHLLGYDHMESDEAEKMEARERELLKPFFGGVF